MPDQDDSLWRKVKKGQLRKELKKFLSKGEAIGKRGDRFVVIPIHQIDLPTFRYNPLDIPGVGQGDGKRGDPVGPDEADDFYGAGSNSGEHLLEEEVSFEELAEILKEELKLPNLKVKGKKNIPVKKEQYSTIANKGPKGLMHFQRMFKKGIIRYLLSGEYDPKKPQIIFRKQDEKYKSWQVVLLPYAGAVIIFIMDVSGSIFGDIIDIMRTICFWIEVLIKGKPEYKKVDMRYIIHDTVAKQVSQNEFFRTREGGGTMISSGYEELANMLDPQVGSVYGSERTIYFPDDWNIYVFHLSDGANWNTADTDKCYEILEKKILPKVNLFGYFQIETPYANDDFIANLEIYFSDNEILRTAYVEKKEDIMPALKEIFGEKKGSKK